MPRTAAKFKQGIAFSMLWTAALITTSCMGFILFFILKQGLPAISWRFLTAYPEALGREGGIFPTIVGTVYLTALVILIAGPIGVGTAIYLTEYTRGGLLTRMIRGATETLAGIPSIIFGLFGFAFLVTFLGFGFSLLSGGITLALMLLPTVIRTAEEAIKTVPVSYREGSLALGATKWVTIIKVVLPVALPGIMTGLVLSVGRAVGETAAVWLTVGGALRLPVSLLDSARPMTLHLYILASEGLSLTRAYATASILIISIALINSAALLLLSRFSLRLRS